MDHCIHGWDVDYARIILWGTNKIYQKTLTRAPGVPQPMLATLDPGNKNINLWNRGQAFANNLENWVCGLRKGLWLHAERILFYSKKSAHIFLSILHKRMMKSIFETSEHIDFHGLRVSEMIKTLLLTSRALNFVQVPQQPFMNCSSKFRTHLHDKKTSGMRQSTKSIPSHARHKCQLQLPKLPNKSPIQFLHIYVRGLTPLPPDTAPRVCRPVGIARFWSFSGNSYWITN